MDPRLPNQDSDEQTPVYSADQSDQLNPNPTVTSEPASPWETPPVMAPGAQYSPIEPTILPVNLPHETQPPPSPPHDKLDKKLLLQALIGFLLFIGLIVLLWKVMPLLLEVHWKYSRLDRGVLGTWSHNRRRFPRRGRF